MRINMKIIRNKYIPFQGFRAINLFGILFVRGNARISERTIRHEAIHTAQMKEMLYIFFYIGYGIEWLIRTTSYSLRYVSRKIRDKVRKWNPYLAYRRISFEREAYSNEKDLSYLDNRKRFAWIKYIK